MYGIWEPKGVKQASNRSLKKWVWAEVADGRGHAVVAIRESWKRSHWTGDGQCGRVNEEQDTVLKGYVVSGKPLACQVHQCLGRVEQRELESGPSGMQRALLPHCGVWHWEAFDCKAALLQMLPGTPVSTYTKWTLEKLLPTTYQQHLATGKNSVCCGATKWFEMGKMISKWGQGMRALAEEALFTHPEGSPRDYLDHALFPSFSPTLFLSFPLLHPAYAWNDSGKARAVFGETLTSDLWPIMRGPLDFMFMPKWWGRRAGVEAILVS